MNKFTIVIPFLVVLFFNGCANITANNYLKHKEIEEGINFTKQELKENPNDASMNYYHGRFLIYKKRYAESIEYFKKAVEENASTEYIYWLGKAYNKNKQYQLEREQYLKILNEKRNYQKSALVRLGLNYYETKEYENAIKTFEKVIYNYGYTPHTLYYYTKALKKTNQLKESEEYILKFLEKYPNHSLAKEAVRDLRDLGNFTYSNYKYLDKIISMKNLSYVKDFNQLDYDEKKLLKKISQPLIEDKTAILTIITYEKDMLKKAQTRAENIKITLLKLVPNINPNQIKTISKNEGIVFKKNKKEYLFNSYVSFTYEK